MASAAHAHLLDASGGSLGVHAGRWGHGGGMPVTSQTTLQSLASMKDDGGAAVTVYLDLDPFAAGTAHEVSSRVRSAIDGLIGDRPAGGEAKRRFDAGVQRIHRFWHEEDVRGGREVHGAALFA